MSASSPGQVVGSLAVDGGDRFSDLDLTFGIAEQARVADVLADWTQTLIDELAAVQLAELDRGPDDHLPGSFLTAGLLQLGSLDDAGGPVRPPGHVQAPVRRNDAAGGVPPAPSMAR